MQKHKIYTRHSKVMPEYRLQIHKIKECVRKVLSLEKVNMPCEVSVLIADDVTVRNINLSYRGIDKTTDVLSFPMLEFSPPGWIEPGSNAVDPETGLTPLGEIVLSASIVRLQAKEYGHCVEQETAYLIVHSVLHLLGYDHVDEADGKRLMREKEKHIMSEMGYRI